jgi:hypothetical protein
MQPELIETLQLPFITNGIATTTDGRLFMALPHSDESDGPRVVEWKDNKAIPYPNATWNSKASSKDYAAHLVLVNSLRIGPEGDLWLVDVGAPEMGKAPLPGGAKLVQVDIHANAVRRVYELGNVTGGHSFVDDVRFHGRVAYLTDAGQPGIIVLNLDTGQANRVLDGASSATATKPVSAEGKTLHNAKGEAVYIHADQLEVSPDGRWLYYQPATGPLSRIETQWLDPKVMEPERTSHIEHFADTPSTGGTAIDYVGNIYLSDTDRQQILKISPDGMITTLIHDPRLLWVDAMWIDARGFLWMPAAQLNRSRGFQGGTSKVAYPIHIYKLKIGSPAAFNDHK